MATYSDVAVNVVHINEINPGTSGVIYTVPAGRRARMRVQRYNAVAAITIALYTLALGSFPNAGGGVSPENLWLTNEIWLYAGDSISVAGINYDFKAVIEEFTNP